jgi:putative membrane protein
MNMIIRILVAAAIAFILAQVLPGVHVNSYVNAIWFAIALGVLNFLLKPILVLLTLPITIITLGLFLLVINTVVVLIASDIVGGFSIDSFWHALLFGLLYSLLTSILFREADRQKN